MFGPKSVNGVTAKLTKMIEELHQVAQEQAERKAAAHQREAAARAEADAAFHEGVLATSIANNLKQLLS